MNASKLKVAIFGAGVTGCDAIRHANDRGIELVAVFDINEALVGQDSGTVAGIQANGVTVISGSDEERLQILREKKPDIALVCTTSFFDTLDSVIRVCADAGVDVLTTAEGVYYPYLECPEACAKYDALAKEKGITIAASGVQDVFFTYLAVILSGCNYGIRKITAVNFAPLDEFDYWKEMPVGRSPEEWASLVEELSGGLDENGEPMGAYNPQKNGLEAVVGILGLTVTEIRDHRLELLTAEEDTFIENCALSIAKGMVLGTSQTTTIHTAEGIVFDCIFISKMTERSKGESPYQLVTIEGDPNMELRVTDAHGEYTTVGSLFNRIPDVLRAEPGVKTVLELGFPYFKAHSFGEYLKR